MTMTWEELLFMHWPVPISSIQPLIPTGLDLDLFEGEAWISLVPFRMTNIRSRYLPRLPGLAEFPELNVRTYVKRRGGMPGVWFFSLDATNPIAVRGARFFFHLPYFDADIQINRTGSEIEYVSNRTHAGAPDAQLKIKYQPLGPVYRSTTGTLEDWLTARYCFYARNSEGALIRTDIHHQPWKLRQAKWQTTVNTMTEPLSLILPNREPLVQYSERTEVVAWLPEWLVA
jgi:uncharacterized protein